MCVYDKDLTEQKVKDELIEAPLTVYVGNLPFDTTDQEILDLFVGLEVWTSVFHVTQSVFSQWIVILVNRFQYFCFAIDSKNFVKN